MLIYHLIKQQRIKKTKSFTISGVDHFVKSNDFSNKTVIPFCTSASSSLGESGTWLQKEAKGGNWKQGHRFSSSPSEDTIKEWTDSLQ